MRSDERVLFLAALLSIVPGLAACGPQPRGGGDDEGDSGGGGDGAGPGGFVDAAPTPDGTGGAGDCAALPATVRDFHRTHPDFETFTANQVFPGLVQPHLGPGRKPVYAPPGGTPHTSGPAGFSDWYNDAPGVNQAIAITLLLEDLGGGRFAYDNDEFFPIDGLGFGGEGFAHNFHFTTEIHTTFEYRGGETFTFRGDDDLWLFINDQLAIDLGGLHEPAAQTVDLDARAGELGLEVGKSYPMDIFHAERHTIASTFHIETTIECFVVP